MFKSATEQLRDAAHTDYSVPKCRDYSHYSWRSRLGLGPFLTRWRHHLNSKVLIKKFAEFEC